MNLFADSSAWIALYDDRDKYHAVARDAFQLLSRRAMVFIMTDYVMAETATMILYRAGHARAVRFGEWALRSINVRQVRVDAALWNEPRTVKKYDDKEFHLWIAPVLSSCAASMSSMRSRSIITLNRWVFGFGRG